MNHKNYTIIFLIIIVLILCTVFYYLHKTRTVILTTSPQDSFTEFKDPNNYFTIRIPSSWSVSSRKDGYNSYQGNHYINTSIMEYKIGTPPAGFTVGTSGYKENGTYVYVDVYTGDGICTTLSNNTTIAGLPAYYDGNSAWVLGTTAAQFTINYRFPGSILKTPEFSEINPGGLMIKKLPPSPTPPSKETKDANQRLVNTVIASFKPTVLIPASCSK